MVPHRTYQWFDREAFTFAQAGSSRERPIKFVMAPYLMSFVQVMMDRDMSTT
jgi:hypothetical protein